MNYKIYNSGYVIENSARKFKRKYCNRLIDPYTPRQMCAGVIQ